MKIKKILKEPFCVTLTDKEQLEFNKVIQHCIELYRIQGESK